MPSRAFTSDNTAGAAPQIIEAVAAAAEGHALPYGADPWTERARTRLGEIFEREVDVFITSTGSAANALALAALSPPWGAVLCHRDSHINNDECGAPEFYTDGAKLVPLGGADAKLDVEQCSAAVRRKVGDVHSVQPSVLSITQATETGSLYTVDEIAALADVARSAGLGVHLDGARFANAVAAIGCTPAEMTWRAGVDIVAFGATKNGAMTADAVVVFDPERSAQLRYRHKRAGQLASKMRFQSAQLAAYLDDDLWLDNATHANAMATHLRTRLREIDRLEAPYGPAAAAGPTANIVFCRLPERVVDGLVGDGFAFYHDRWEPGVCRFVTSFRTDREDIDDLAGRIRHHLDPSA